MIDSIQIHHEAGKFNIVVTDEIVREYVKVFERDGKQIGLIQQPLVVTYLSTVGLEAGLPLDKARELAAQLSLHYQPFKTNDLSYYCNLLEFNRFHALYLMMVYKIDPLGAWHIADKGQFWQQFFPGTKTPAIPLPELYGTSEDVQKAAPIQRQQAVDLMILRKRFDDYAVHLMGNQQAEFLDNNNDLPCDQYIKSKEIILAYIDQIMMQASAQAWLPMENSFQYNVDWLMGAWQIAMKEINEQDALDGASHHYSIDYPVLYVDELPAITTENKRIKIINSSLSNHLCRKLIGKIEVVNRILAEYFLTAAIINIGGCHISEAKKLVKKYMDVMENDRWRGNLKINGVYKKFDLYNTYRVYLNDTVADVSYHHVRYFYKFWRTFFPDSGVLYNFLPALTGSARNIIKADLIRRRQIESLLDLKCRIIAATEQMQIESDEHKKLISALDKKAVAYINQIAIRNNAQDWLSSRSVEYNWAWLQPKMEEFWAAVISEYGSSVQANDDAQEQALSVISNPIKQSNVIKAQKPVKQSIQGYEVNMLMLGKLRGEVKLIRAAKDDGVVLEENEDTDLSIFEFDVKEHRLMCLEAMKNLVRNGCFEPDSITIGHKEQHKDSKITTKTYKITDKGQNAPLLTPVQAQTNQL